MSAEEERILRRTSQNAFDGFFDGSEILGRKAARRSRRESALIERANLMALEERWVFPTVFPSWFDSDNVLEVSRLPIGRGTWNNQNGKLFRTDVIDRDHNDRACFVASYFFAEDRIQEDKKELSALDQHIFDSPERPLICSGSPRGSVQSITRWTPPARRRIPG
jgi:hypothetical protein